MTGVAFASMLHRVRDDLDQQHRYAHVVRVARFAERLAAAHGVDTTRARIAGALHDLARLFSFERLLAECTLRKMPIDAFERANPIVLHARLGAELARERFGIDDPAILSAIAKHTVASETMSRLDCVLFLADGLEPGRDFRERPHFAELSLRDLDAGMRAVLYSNIEYLRARGQTVAPQTIAAAKLFERPGITSEDRKTA